MKIIFLSLFIIIGCISFINAQKVDKSGLFGTWYFKKKTVTINNLDTLNFNWEETNNINNEWIFQREGIVSICSDCDNNSNRSFKDYTW